MQATPKLVRVTREEAAPSAAGNRDQRVVVGATEARLCGDHGGGKRASTWAATSSTERASGRAPGIHETLLLNSKQKNKKAMKSQTVWVPRSNLLERVQSFLPEMASANDELRREMESVPVQDFDIEHVDDSTENVIEMNVALVQLSGSSAEEEDSTSEGDSDDSSVCNEVTVDNMKLPKPKGEGRIEIVDSKSNE